MAYKLQRSFSAGEISPLMQLRNDNEIHAEALGTLRNMVPTPQGPAESRKGFELVGELQGELQARLFDLDISFGESYVIAITPNVIYVLDRNGFTLGINLVTNPQFTFGGADWISNLTTFAAGTAILNPNPANPANITQNIVPVDMNDEHIIEVIGVSGEFGNSVINIHIGTSAGGNEIATFVNAGRRIIETFIPGVANFWITVEVNTGGVTKIIDAINVFEAEDAGDIVTFPSPYSLQDILELQVDKEPGNKVMLFFTRAVSPHELTFSGTHIWDFHEIDFDFGVDEEEPPGDKPPPWGETEYPGCVTFYAGRMAVGGTFSDPIGIWLSKPRQYRNFDLGEEESQVADDALYLPLDKHGELVWLKGNKQLFAGLDSGEHVIYGEQGIIAANNAATEQHSTYGSSRIQATVVNEEIAYVDTRGRKVRLIDYDSNNQNMTSFDISFIAEHITEGRIIEMDHGSSPLGTLFFPTFLGQIITCHIEKDRGIYGWGRYDTEGFIQSVTFVREFGIDVPWIVVIRDGRLFVERMEFNSDVYMDSYLTVVEPVSTNIFFGFDHLIGKLVQVLADGAVHPDTVVLPNGSIPLQAEANIVSAGYGFLAELESLPQMDDVDDGNTRSHIKRFSKVSVSVLNCPRPIVNGQDTYRRDPETPMDTREIDRTEIIEINNSGWDNESLINVSQPLPLNLVVAGVGGKLKSNKL